MENSGLLRSETYIFFRLWTIEVFLLYQEFQCWKWGKGKMESPELKQLSEYVGKSTLFPWNETYVRPEFNSN